MLSAALARSAEFTLTALPGGLTAPLSQVIGTAAWAASPATRANVVENLKIIAPERANAGTARKVFVGQSRNYLDIFQLPKVEPKKLIAAIDHRGWDNFLRAQEEGKGVIVASAHLGPIPIVGQMLNAHGYEVVLSIETERSELQRAINRKRASMGLQLAFVENPFPVFRAIRQKKIFGLLADRAVTGVGERVPFFGREALLPSVHVVLGMRTGAPIVPAFSLRDGGRMSASFEPPLEVPDTGNRDADVREGVRRWGLVLERYIRSAPEQWAVFERFWER